MGSVQEFLCFLFHLTTDEKYKLQVARNYMVDYLENICLHRYEKASRKEKEESQKMKEKVVAASVDVSMSKNMAVNGESSVVGVDMSAGRNVATCTDVMTEKAGTAGTETSANRYAENENIVAANATVTPIRKELSKGDSAGREYSEAKGRKGRKERRKRREKVGGQGCPDPTDSGRIHGVSELCSKDKIWGVADLSGDTLL